MFISPPLPHMIASDDIHLNHLIPMSSSTRCQLHQMQREHRIIHALHEIGHLEGEFEWEETRMQCVTSEESAQCIIHVILNQHLHVADVFCSSALLLVVITSLYLCASRRVPGWMGVYSECILEVFETLPSMHSKSSYICVLLIETEGGLRDNCSELMMKWRGTSLSNLTQNYQRSENLTALTCCTKRECEFTPRAVAA